MYARVHTRVCVCAPVCDPHLHHPTPYPGPDCDVAITSGITGKQEHGWAGCKMIGWVADERLSEQGGGGVHSFTMQHAKVAGQLWIAQTQVQPHMPICQGSQLSPATKAHSTYTCN